MARTGEKRYSVLVRKPEGYLPLGRFRHRWKDIFSVLKKSGSPWAGFMWRRIGTSGGLL